MKKNCDRKFRTTKLLFLIVVTLFFLMPQLTTAAYDDQGALYQPQRTITGKVADESGVPIPGANVFVKGQPGIGSITDAEGNYSLTVPADAETLVFSFVGMEKQEVETGDRTVINVTLKAEFSPLDEVVVIGYGTIRKSDLTGAVTSVKSDVVEKFSISHPAEALQGRVAGVSIQMSDGGAPGADMNVRVRGIGTTGDSAPLYIIDGLPGSLYMLNPDDIESIEVLKDGAAAAIYGSRAANGVVIISTKSGKKGTLSIDFKADYGIVENTNKMEFTNSNEYVRIATLAFQNAGEPLPAYLTMPIQYDTDWQDEIFKKGAQQNYVLRVSGASDILNYSFSSSYFNQEGTMIGTAYEKVSVRAKGEMKKGIFKLFSNVAYTEDKQDEQVIFMRGAYEILPLIPVYDPGQRDGFGLADIANNMPSSRNPVGDNYFNTEYNKDQYLEARVTAELEPVKGLTYKLNLGLNNSNKFNFDHHPPYLIDAKDEAFYTYLQELRSNWREELMENILTYSKEIGKHNITVMGAFTRTKNIHKETAVGAFGYQNVYEASGGDLIVTEIPAGFLDPYLMTLDAALGGTFSGWGEEYVYVRTSLLGRINYSYNNKYLLQATFRRDGSSKFGQDKRYGNFPSIAMGWKISEEPFMQNIPFVSNLKLRASWGVLGSEGILDSYDHQSLISTGSNEFYYYSRGNGETPWAGSIARTLENRTLQWEEIQSGNIGLDFAFMEGQISGSLNYYNNQSSKMLVDKPVEPSAGIQTPRVNFGEVENKGIELELGYRNMEGEFRYGVSGTFSTNKNNVLKLGFDKAVVYGEAVNYTEHQPNQTRIGKEIGAFYLYQMDGIFQSQAEVDAHNSLGNDSPLQPYAAPGDIRFKDMNEDGVLDDKDMVYSGTGIPKVEYGLTFDGEYKGIDVSVSLVGAAGHKIYNANRYYTERMNNNYNYAASTVDAWTPENPGTTMPRPVIGDPNQNIRPSTRFLEDGDFLRIKNVQLGYSLPKNILNKMQVAKLRIYLSAQNLYTFTKYSGFDPEVSRGTTNAGRGIFSTGLDRTLYPIPRTYLMGIQLSF